MGRRWLAAVLVIAAFVVVGWLLLGGVGSGRERGAVSVSEVEARVEQLRGLRFLRSPVVRFVTEAEMRQIVSREVPAKVLGPAASDFTRPVPASFVPLAERLEALELLGAVPVGTTFGEVLFGAVDDPGGLLDPRTGAVYVRRASGAGFGGEDGVLAHELTHAIEFQHNLHSAAPFVTTFDQLLASRALIEGPAVLAQYLYDERYGSSRGTLDQFLAGFAKAANRVLHLPPLLLADAVFPYVEGARYVYRLWRTGGWAAVTQAEHDPPTDTRSMLLGNEPAAHDTSFDVDGILGHAWQPEPDQPLGDYDTTILLSAGSARARSSLLRTWRGGSLQVWNDLGTGRVLRCRRPCAARFVLLMSWRWANASIAEVAARDLRLSLAPILAASAQGGTRLRTTLGSSVAIAVDHQATTIALAPSPSMAQALAAANAG